MTYWKDAKAIIDEKCVSCHLDAGIGPFALETWAQVQEFAPLFEGPIHEQTMPPWPPNPNCNSYEDERLLSAYEHNLLLDWIAEGCPEGDPADAPPAPEPRAAFEPDIKLALLEPYTPKPGVDDYRCFVIPWPEDQTEPTYVIAQAVDPDQRQLVHHVVVFVADASQTDFFLNLDNQHPGPGYECFGGPGTEDLSVRWLADWVPGLDAWRAPPGSGIEVKPRSSLIVQVHYNAVAQEPSADQTRIEFRVSDEVERPGVFVPVLNTGWALGSVPMTIPAGDDDVHHSVTLARNDWLFSLTLGQIGIGPEEEVEVWRSALHMHQIGSRGRLSIVRSGEDESCLLQIDDWDFNWQGDYMLQKPVSFGAGDAMQLDCWYDNSADNQPIVDGEPKVPETLGWGDGSDDEMCVGIVYVTGKQGA